MRASPPLVRKRPKKASASRLRCGAALDRASAAWTSSSHVQPAMASSILRRSDAFVEVRVPASATAPAATVPPMAKGTAMPVAKASAPATVATPTPAATDACFDLALILSASRTHCGSAGIGVASPDASSVSRASALSSFATSPLRSVTKSRAVRCTSTSTRASSNGALSHRDRSAAAPFCDDEDASSSSSSALAAVGGGRAKSVHDVRIVTRSRLRFFVRRPPPRDELLATTGLAASVGRAAF
mmetsp:Transcript_25613/g.102115  ORF Transcript_25613/g.102115 Transcript_25613/m.102115 type:complete len:244 (+) Transcript_25613:743-1474(+)